MQLKKEKEPEMWAMFYRMFYEFVMRQDIFIPAGQDNIIGLMALEFERKLFKSKYRLRKFKKLKASINFIKKEEEILSEYRWLFREAKRWFLNLTNHNWGEDYEITKRKKKIIRNGKIEAGVARKLIIKKQQQEEEYLKSKKSKIEERAKVTVYLRYQILKRDNFTCKYCGRRPPEVTLQVDHKKPISKGGKSIPSNLATSCRECNIGKRNNY